jgi:Protein of unknown function, DUF547
MRTAVRGWAFAAVALLLAVSRCGAEGGSASGARKQTVEVRAGIGHAAWTRLLKKYVNGRGEVAYGAWKNAAADREALTRYLEQFAAGAAPAAKGAEKIASLVNAYNAFTIDWVLRNYPTASIRSLPRSFTAARNRFGGREVSLDDIEHETLRPLAGYRVHAVLSCASRSCPPLAAEALEPARIEAQMDARMAAWLDREDLNRFLPDRGRVEISQVFRWYAEDFQKAGGLRQVLARHAPERYRDFLSKGGYSIDYLPYDWGLNDQGPEGRHYGGLRLWFDEARERLRSKR